MCFFVRRRNASGKEEGNKWLFLPEKRRSEKKAAERRFAVVFRRDMLLCKMIIWAMLLSVSVDVP